jgi:hypothetical protein
LLSPNTSSRVRRLRLVKLALASDSS